LGEKIAQTILSELERGGVVTSHDASTNVLINHYQKTSQKDLQ